MADNTINGTSGDDTLQTPGNFDTNEVYGGDGNDFIVDGGPYGNQDSFYGGAGNDNILAGSGNDIIDTGTGDDNATGSQGDDTFVVNDNFGNDTLDGGGSEEISGDVLDATGMTTGATLTFGVEITTESSGGGPPGSGGGPPGSGGDGGGGPSGGGGETTVTGALLEAGPGNTAEVIGVESFTLGGGNDTVIDDSGNNTVNMGAGDDIFRITDGFGADTVHGGDGGEVLGDLIDGSAVTPDVVVTFTGDGTGTFTDGTDTLVFDGIERVATGAGNDSIFGGAGDDSASGGAGDDVFVITDGGGADFFDGGEGGETTGDILDAAALTAGVTITYTGDSATLSDGTHNGGFTDVEKVVLGSGNDTVTGGTSDESITANAGDDSFVVLDNFGNDTIAFGSGQDILDGQALSGDVTVTFNSNGTGTLSEGSNSVSFSGVENVVTGDGYDTITGSAGDETINTGRGDDRFIIADGFGTDVFNAGEFGGSQGDWLDGSALTGDTTVTFSDDEAGTLTVGAESVTFSDVEIVETGSGNDSITGSAGDEVLGTGAGDDQIDGGIGADEIYAGAGNDTIAAADGDTIFAGSGDDVIRLENTGEASNSTINVDGGSETTGAGDVLDLRQLADIGTLTATDDGTGSFSGSVTLKDGTLLNFQDIETIQYIICFTPGTMIHTPHGPRDIAQLRVGDMVRTRDSGVQPIRWIQSRTVPAIERFAPIILRAGVLPSLTKDLLVSPQHRMLFQGYQAELLFGEREVLVPAAHLVNGKDVTQVSGGAVTYIHMMFDAHEIVYANGAASESFHPGTIGLSAVTENAREELFSLFPALRSDPNGYGQTARRCLRQHETQLLSV